MSEEGLVGLVEGSCAISASKQPAVMDEKQFKHGEC